MSEVLDDFIEELRSRRWVTQSDLERSGYCDSMSDTLRWLVVDDYYLPTLDNGYPVRNECYVDRPWLRMKRDDADIFEHLGAWIISDSLDRDFVVRFIGLVDDGDDDLVSVQMTVTPC